MEIIIGREEGARRLHCIADGREFNVGQAGSVPTSVSRKHCKLSVNGDKITIENLREQNITFVDGNQVFSKGITSSSKVQLGNEKYTIPLQQILLLAAGRSTTPGNAAPKTEAPKFSLRPLKSVWDEYDQRKLDIQESSVKKANQQRLQSIATMGGSLCCVMLGPIGYILTALGLCAGVYFFLQGNKQDSVQRQLHDLDEEFAKKYKCPNPACGKPFGAAPYRQIEFSKQCFACGCKYTH